MFKPDWVLSSEIAHGSIVSERGCTEQVKEDNGRKVLSYGVSCAGYDLRMSDMGVYVFHFPWWMRILAWLFPLKYAVDPKNFDKKYLRKAKVYEDENGVFAILPPHSYCLGVSVEAFKLNNRLIGIAVGKSTYARCAVSANITPLEPGWSGYLTLELSNDGPAPVRVYLNEGVVQVLFGETDTENGYRERGGKYEHQKCEVTLPRA